MSWRDDLRDCLVVRMYFHRRVVNNSVRTQYPCPNKPFPYRTESAPKSPNTHSDCCPMSDRVCGLVRQLSSAYSLSLLQLYSYSTHRCVLHVYLLYGEWRVLDSFRDPASPSAWRLPQCHTTRNSEHRVVRTTVLQIRVQITMAIPIDIHGNDTKRVSKPSLVSFPACEGTWRAMNSTSTLTAVLIKRCLAAHSMYACVPRSKQPVP